MKSPRINLLTNLFLLLSVLFVSASALNFTKIFDPHFLEKLPFQNYGDKKAKSVKE
jgi:hypothetical protein